MPGISRNAAHFPQLLGHHQVVFGVALEPAFFVVTACRKQHVEAANGGVVPATLVELGDVSLALPRDFLVAELAGICGRAATRRNEPHVAIIVVEILVADHHAANGLLAEVIAEKGVDLAGRFRRVRCYRQFANLEYRVGVAFDGNVVHAESLVTHGNLVFADLHLGGCRNHVARIAVARGSQHGAYIYAVDCDFRGGPVVLLDQNLGGNIVDGGFFDLDGECDAARVCCLCVFSARIISIFDNSCASQIFGFVSCRCG